LRVKLKGTKTLTKRKKIKRIRTKIKENNALLTWIEM